MDNEPAETGINRNDKGQFEKGTSGNPKGRPEGPIHIKKLEEAILRAEQKLDINFLDRVIERALIRDKVLLAVLGKFIPNKEKIEHSTDGPLEISIKRADAEDRD